MNKKLSQVKISGKKFALFAVIVVIIGFALLFIGTVFSRKSDSLSHTEIPAPDSSPPVALQPEKPDIREKPESVPAKPLPERPVQPVPEKPESSVPERPEPPPSTPFVPPAVKKSGKLIFIFDDAGNSLKQIQPFLTLPFPLTIAVLPSLPDSKTTADNIRKAGKEVFLHQPMQAVDLSINPGPSSVRPDMSTGEAARIVRENIAQIAPIAGMNNHEGSLITADRNLIGAVLDVCIDEKIIFLDSRTSSQTQAPFAAMERGMHIWERDVFLDNNPDPNEMRIMVHKGLAIADKKGYAIMIGHVQNPSLAELLRGMYGDLRAQGYVFTTLSRMEK